MSLFDEWNSLNTPMGRGDTNIGQNMTHAYAPPPPTQSVEDSKFQIEQQELDLSKYGSALCFATAMNIILIGTSDNDLLRWNIETGRLEEMVASTKPEEKIFQVFLSPDGLHAIISMTNGVSYYLPSNSSKLAQLQKIKAQVSQSVSWFKYDNDPNVQHALIGTTKGAIFDLSLEDNREKGCKLLFELPQTSNRPLQNVIWGVRLMKGNIDPSLRETSTRFDASSTHWQLMFVTSLYKYHLEGGPTLEALFAKYGNNLRCIELPGSLNDSQVMSSSQLTFFVSPPSSPDSTPEDRGDRLARALVIPSSFAWLTASGVFTGSIRPDVSHGEFICNSRIIDIPKIVDQEVYNRKLASGEGIGAKPPYLQPLSIILTEFHLIVLFRQYLYIINTLNDQTVMQTQIPKAQFGSVKSLSVDESNNTYWILTDRHLLEIVCVNEEAGIWKIFFERNDFAMALDYCQTDEERRQVIDREANYLFARGAYVDAARRFHKANAPFEVVAMKYLTEYARYSSSTTPLLQEMVNSTTSTGQASHAATHLQNLVGNTTLLTDSSRQIIGPSASNILQSVADGGLGGSTNPLALGGHFATGGLGISDNLSYLNNSSISYAISIFKLIECRYEIYNGLKYYLELQLQNLHGSDRTKLTLLSDWIVELYVNTLVTFDTPLVFNMDRIGCDPARDHHQQQQYDELLAIEQRRKELYELECEQVLEFLQNYHDCLHPTTTYSLLSSSGRTREFAYYAELCGAHNLVVDLHLRNHEYLLALQALSKLRSPVRDTAPSTTTTATQSSSSSTAPSHQPRPATKPLRFSKTPTQRYVFSGDVDIVYRTLPTLIMHVPSETVDFLIETDGLSCARVLTSLVRCGVAIDFDFSSAKPQQQQPSQQQQQQRQVKHSSTKPSLNSRGSKALSQSLSKLNISGNLSATIQQSIGGVDAVSSSSSASPAQQQQTKQQQQAAARHLMSLESPDNIVGVSIEKEYLLHTTRYLEFIIVNDLGPIAAHNLYIALLIQLRDNDTLLSYLKAHRHNNLPNRVFALRLCCQHNEVLYPSTIELCLQLQRHVQAIRYALLYDIDLAKVILADTSRNLSATNTTLDLDLWTEYVNVLSSKGKSIIEIVSDIRSWNSNVTLLQILPCLPDVTRMDQLSHNVTEQLIDFNTQLSTLNNEMNQLRKENEVLKQEMVEIQHSTHLVTPTYLCDICSKPILLSSSFYFQCTHAYHVQCCVNFAFDFLRRNPRRKKEIFLQKLADFTDGVSVNLNNVNVHESAIQYLTDRVVAEQLSREEEVALVEEYAQSACPFCGEIMIESSAQDYISPEDYQNQSHEWTL